MLKHQSLEHPGELPNFHFKMVSSHRSALSRQVREAVRIRRRGGMGSILNSKGEFSRCHIPRLVVEEEDEDVRKERIQKEHQERMEATRILDEKDELWEKQKQRAGELKDRKRGRGDADHGV